MQALDFSVGLFLGLGFLQCPQLVFGKNEVILSHPCLQRFKAFGKDFQVMA
jgi:hypothetical protein